MSVTDLINAKTTGEVYLTALASRFQIKETRDQKHYLDFYLTDKTGEVLVRKWNFSDNDRNNLVNAPDKFAIIDVQISIKIYNNKMQYIVQKYNLNSDNLPHENFYFSAPYPVAKMWHDLQSFMKLITDEDYRKLLQNIFDDTKTAELFQRQRAAVIFHHNVYGGLLWHTLTMLKMAAKLVEVYDYLQVNVSLLYTAIIMHDFAKIYEIADFFDNNYTLEGRLIGHISLGAQIVHNYATNLNTPSAKIMLLKHCILSSHGKLEFGSPVAPATLEALIVSRLDDLDAKLNTAYKDLAHTPLHDFSENKYPDFAKQGFYKHLETKK